MSISVKTTDSSVVLNNWFVIEKELLQMLQQLALISDSFNYEYKGIALFKDSATGSIILKYYQSWLRMSLDQFLTLGKQFTIGNNITYYYEEDAVVLNQFSNTVRIPKDPVFITNLISQDTAEDEKHYLYFRKINDSLVLLGTLDRKNLVFITKEDLARTLV